MNKGGIRSPYPINRVCRVCENKAFGFYEDSRPFYICKFCGLIFTDCLLTAEEISKHYRNQYKNIFDWNKEAEAVLAVVSFVVNPQKILDYGSGSDSLANAFRTLGLCVDSYEPMLHGDFVAEQYNKGYDLVVLNEVIEHVYDIWTLVDNVNSVVRQGGIIFISTYMTDEIINAAAGFQEQFHNWWYKDDQTHISFFCQLTFEYICSNKARNQLRMLFAGANGVILQKV